MNNTKLYYGKYRGIVTNNIDPEMTGRVQVEVPGVKATGWAMPCVPVAGLQAGVFVVPPIGSQVWVEFEQGNADYPIWTGGFWGNAAEVPVVALSPAPVPPGQNFVLQTALQNLFEVSDAPPTSTSGGIILKSAGGASIIVNDSGIYISNGKGASIVMLGSKVTIQGLS